MENMMKPYETCENIDAMNDLAIEANMDVFKEKDQVIMRINNNVPDNIDICLMWLDYVIENKGMYEELREFVIVKMKGFIDKEVIVNIGAVIQKGEELCLDGFFGLEIIPKSSDIDKFNFNGKLKFTKNEKKVYAVALMVAIIILSCNKKSI